MNVRAPLVVGVALLLAAGSARPCTNVYGIPNDCRMSVRVHASRPDGGQFVELMSVHMKNNWAYASGVPSPDGAVNVLFLEDELEVQFRGRRRRIRRDPAQFVAAHSIQWDPSGRRFAFHAPRPEGDPRMRIAVVDVRAMSGTPPYEVVYTPPKGTVAYEATWVGEGALLALERYEDKKTALVRVDVATGARTNLVVRGAGEALIDFVQGTHRPSDGTRRVIAGTPDGLLVIDVGSGEVRRLGLPGMGLHNIDLAPDGRTAALFYRRPVPGSDGRAFAGVYLLDVDAALAGRVDALERLDPATDAHTLWLSPDATQVLWCTPTQLRVRRVAARGEPSRVVQEAPDDATVPDELKGAAFDAAGQRIAVTSATGLRVLDLRTGETVEVFRDEGVLTFYAAPWWAGDRIVMTAFTDVAAETARPRGSRSR